MLKTYIIKHEPVTTSDIVDGEGNVIKKGTLKDKYNVYYYHDDEQIGIPEFYGYSPDVPADGTSIKEGYVKHENSL